MRKVDIAHARQTVPEALAQLLDAIKRSRRDGEDALLVIHGYGASGAGGAIRDGVMAELPRLARLYGFRSFSDADRRRIPRDLDFDARLLNAGSSLLVFRSAGAGREAPREFRANYRNLKKIRVPAPQAASAQKPGSCRHADRQLLSRGPTGSTYRCRTCGTRFLLYVT